MNRKRKLQPNNQRFQDIEQGTQSGGSYHFIEIDWLVGLIARLVPWILWWL